MNFQKNIEHITKDTNLVKNNNYYNKHIFITCFRPNSRRFAAIFRKLKVLKFEINTLNILNDMSIYSKYFFIQTLNLA